MADGKKHTEESRRKIAETRLTRGIGHTEVSRTKISESLKGNQRLKGHKHSEETRAKMRKSHLENGAAEASRQRRLGTKLSEETKRKIGEASARIHAARRAAKADAGQLASNPPDDPQQPDGHKPKSD